MASVLILEIRGTCIILVDTDTALCQRFPAASNNLRFVYRVETDVERCL